MELLQQKNHHNYASIANSSGGGEPGMGNYTGQLIRNRNIKDEISLWEGVRTAIETNRGTKSRRG